MSRIPIPTHTTRPASPVPSLPTSPERPSVRSNTTPSNSSVHFGANTTMSSLSGFQSSASLSETRKKQSKRDEVSFLSSVDLHILTCNNRLFERRSNQSFPGSVLYPLLTIVRPNAVDLEASLHPPKELSPLSNLVRL